MRKKRIFVLSLWWGVLLIWLVMGNLFTLVASSFTIPPYQYLHRSWNSQHGLPQDSVYCLLRDSSGNLLIGTGLGVIRFDGVNFRRFSRDKYGDLMSRQVTGMMLSYNGDIWITTYGSGVIGLQGKKFTHYSTENGLPNGFILAIAEDSQQNIWLGTMGSGLVKLEEGRFTAFTTSSGLLHNVVTALLRDTRGRIWIGTEGGLNRFDNGVFSSFKGVGLPGNHITRIYEDRGGYLWVGTTHGVARSSSPVNEYKKNNPLTPGESISFKTIPGIPSLHVHSILEDWSSTVWVTVEKQIFHVQFSPGQPGSSAQVKRFSQPGLFFSNSIISMYQDNEGILWFGTLDSGFGNLYKETNTFCTVIDEFARFDVMTVCQVNDGSIYIGDREGGLHRLKGGDVKDFGPVEGFSASSVASVCGGQDGDLWIGTPEGLWNFRDNRFNLLPGSPTHINVLHVDIEGQLWIGTEGNGLYRYNSKTSKSTKRFQHFGIREGLVSLDILAINRDSYGTIWVGTRHGLYRFRKNDFRRFTRANGLSSDIITDLFSDLDGSLWIATHGGGLNRFKQGVFSQVNNPGHFAGSVIYSILEDKMQRLWFSTNNGIFCFSRYHLNKYVDGKRGALDCYHLHETRLGTAVFNGGSQPAGWHTDNGNLWFPTSSGVTVIVPNKDLFRLPPSQINITEVLVNERPVDIQEISQLPSATTKIEIHFSAPEYISPEKVRYKCILLPTSSRFSSQLDDQWDGTPSISDRLVIYPHLTPGHYVFVVSASSSEGVWDYSRVARLSFFIKEKFVNSIWFYGILAVSVLLVFLVFQFVARRGATDRPGLFSRTGKYKTFTLNKKNSQKYLKDLIQLMEEEKPYLDAEMTLPKLAALLDIGKEELSQLINKELFLNFNAFLNKYRIAEAKQKLRDPKENQFVILKIAHDVGFNSKSTFNSVFKQMTGLSPSQYRKKYQKSTENEPGKK